MKNYSSYIVNRILSGVPVRQVINEAKPSFFDLERKGYDLVDINYAENKTEYAIYKQRAIKKYGPLTLVYRTKSDTPGLMAYEVYAKVNFDSDPIAKYLLTLSDGGYSSIADMVQKENDKFYDAYIKAQKLLSKGNNPWEVKFRAGVEKYSPEEWEVIQRNYQAADKAISDLKLYGKELGHINEEKSFVKGPMRIKKGLMI